MDTDYQLMLETVDNVTADIYGGYSNPEKAEAEWESYSLKEKVSIIEDRLQRKLSPNEFLSLKQIVGDK